MKVMLLSFSNRPTCWTTGISVAHVAQWIQDGRPLLITSKRPTAASFDGTLAWLNINNIESIVEFSL